jgi:hypothetical protein
MDWLQWALAEGATMGGVKVFGHAAMGPFVGTLPGILFATGIVGLMQAVVAAIILAALRVCGQNVVVVPAMGYIARILLFGILATGATLCAPAAFITGARANIAANTFIVAVLPIYGTAIAGRFIFKQRLQLAHYKGLAIAALATLLVTTPSLNSGEHWIWIVFSSITMICATGTRLAAMSLKRYGEKHGLVPINPFVLQLWGGGVMAFSLLGLPLAGIGAVDVVYSVNQSNLFWIAAYVTAGGNMMWWTFRLWAVPEQGTPLAMKELPACSAYLACAAILGHFFGHDRLTWLTVLGLTLFIPAFFVGQPDARKYYAKRLSHMADIASAYARQAALRFF